MIARVRIAPMQHWCEYEIDKMSEFPEVNYPASVGFDVRIHTDSMKVSAIHGCTGRTWLVVPSDLDRLFSKTGGKCSPDTRFCEHMLEMD